MKSLSVCCFTIMSVWFKGVAVCCSVLYINYDCMTVDMEWLHMNYVCIIQMCCSVLQCVAQELWLYDCWNGRTAHELRLYDSSVLQCVVVSVLHMNCVCMIQECCSALQCVAVCCSLLQCVAHELCLYDPSVLQCVAQESLGMCCFTMVSFVCCNMIMFALLYLSWCLGYFASHSHRRVWVHAALQFLHLCVAL